MSILAYHMVEPRFFWGVTRVTPQRFRKQIEWLIAQNFTFQTISSYLNSHHSSNTTIALTFDDGYASVYHHAFAYLKTLDIRATLFVNPAFVGQFNTWDINVGGIRFRHMSWPQLEILRDAGWEIGIHGFSHKDLTRLENYKVEEEICKAKYLLQRNLGICSPVISYPFGNVNSPVYYIAKQYGYTAGLVMSGSSETVPPEFRIQRTGIYLWDTRTLLRFKVKTQNNVLSFGVQKVMDMCSNATVLLKQKSWTNH